MAGIPAVAVFFYISLVSTPILGTFDPFMDQTMFMIDWKGPLLETPQETETADNVVIMTKDQEQYRCILPELYDKKQQDTMDSYQGPTPEQLMTGLFGQTTCSYRLESYWTYELCHGKHLRQYHEVKDQGKKPKLQEYYLGFGRPTRTDAPPAETEPTTSDDAEEPSQGKDSNIKYRRIDGVDLPFYEVMMRDGTPCDLTQQPRQTRVLYVCQPDGHGEVYELKETSTCEYEVMVLTSLLCSHPLFRPKNPPVNKISCHALSGSPVKPQTLEDWDREAARSAAAQQVQQELLFGVPGEEDHVAEEPMVPPKRQVPRVLSSKSTPPHDASTNINKLTDKQVMRDLMSGEYCLQGGTGWWKHEICIGRFARQFHKDATGETKVILGRFDETEHLLWLEQHPNKRPKPLGQRKYLNYMYTGGDVCDVTGKPRKVEVRLKCVQTTSVHGLSLYLTEPATCEYVLVVESAMLCDLMDQADDNALLRSVDL